MFASIKLCCRAPSSGGVCVPGWGLVFFGDGDAQPAQAVRHPDLASEARARVTVIGAFEKAIFVRAHGRKDACELCRDMHVAGRARAGAAAQREDVADGRVADHLHDAQPGRGLQGVCFAFTRCDDQFGHR